ncbi:type II toxin-antitoxin system RelE/ParE family toxin [Caulobacter sp. AP07]|uniref:type II toxin-antitoxin system RelE/ParE family toxin n=1 Tax=Caulobacter sp. AP07 TaxID=1144304 RepID=UPI001930D848|nr:type II toxin-antitoxin system RelE/ParE family toxin [Caulobacter sp. AP07]
MTPPRDLELTLLARDDIADLLDASVETFGPIARGRHEVLIAVALADVCGDPGRAGSVERPELGEGTRTYHLRHSRDRARTEQGKVAEPRHLLVYELPDARRLRVLRVLHEAMDLERHVPRRDF